MLFKEIQAGGSNLQVCHLKKLEDRSQSYMYIIWRNSGRGANLTSILSGEIQAEGSINSTSTSFERTQAEGSILQVCHLKKLRQRGQSHKYVIWRNSREPANQFTGGLAHIFRHTDIGLPRMKQITSTFGCRWHPSGTSRNRWFNESRAWIKVFSRTLGLKNACGSRYFTGGKKS